MKSIKFSFVILTWNRSIMLSICIKNLLQSIQDQEVSEIIIMDNGSADDTSTLLTSYSNHPLFRIYRLSENYGLNSYKKLLSKARGKFIIMIDEDVLSFPGYLDTLFERYFAAFPDYGFLALDVVQNEFTNGAKPAEHFYLDDSRVDLTIQRGPTGAWCSCFRRSNFRKVKIFFNLLNISMRRSHDTTLSFLFRNVLRLKHGIIKGQTCFHACGPYYAQMYGYLDMQAEKYRTAGIDDLYQAYKTFKDT